ncbi:elongator complex protein 1, partial [Aphelenchoides avenae]
MEHLALLNDLDSKTPDAYRRYHMDLLVEDWASALKHIAQVDERFDECIQHIKRHDLYLKALAVFRGTAKYEEIFFLCAEHSLTEARDGEAALTFQRCDDTANALKCYRLARDHRKYVERAKACRQPREQVVAKLKKLVEEQESRKNFAAVAEMLAYIDEEANASLETAPKDRVAALQSQCAQWSSDIERHSHEQLRRWMDAEGDLDVGQSEAMSEASSTVSNMSKLSQLREGSQYEEREEPRSELDDYPSPMKEMA